MNEQVLINMLSELDAGSLNENFTDKDVRRKDGNIFKRAYFYIRVLGRKEDLAGDSILMKHWDEYMEAAEEPLNQEDNVQENSSEWGFPIHVFKREIKNIVKLVSAIIAAILVIVGLLLVIIKRRKGIKVSLKKMQISY
ncbi:hypothetical protein [Anaerocolumna xylanovorans]|uniref:Uncharacterized protein n=1 Tax=Anaerocolumna xylanovorans DSM 12503 TaxID=1121345 RepID=A0A1M7YGU8_9FIRM|nr:hypothetical protein [Anaerocolumna xylanovorans]SHO51874.1 hypothetical protein SAMN02745217_03379 [Anaerocolumna xylanovorans DSM 12503]